MTLIEWILLAVGVLCIYAAYDFHRQEEFWKSLTPEQLARWKAKCEWVEQHSIKKRKA